MITSRRFLRHIQKWISLSRNLKWRPLKVAVSFYICRIITENHLSDLLFEVNMKGSHADIIRLKLHEWATISSVEYLFHWLQIVLWLPFREWAFMQLLNISCSRFMIPPYFVGWNGMCWDQYVIWLTNNVGR